MRCVFSREIVYDVQGVQKKRAGNLTSHNFFISEQILTKFMYDMYI